MTEPTLAETMQGFAEQAAALAQEVFQVRLNYSEESLTEAERILGVFHDDLPKGFWKKLTKRGPSRREIERIAHFFGSYLGEVIRRRWSGAWANQGEQPGRVIALQVEDVEIYPTLQAHKRLVNGSQDSILLYYQWLVQQLTRTE
jgi:hypothetical protein